MAEGKILADKNHNAFSSLKRQLSEFIPNRYILEHFYLEQQQQQKKKLPSFLVHLPILPNKDKGWEEEEHRKYLLETPHEL